MSFLNNLVNEFTHQGGNQDQGYRQNQYGGGQQYGQPQYNQGPPQVPPPWVAEWDARDNRWLFINRETGQRQFELPQSYNGGYQPQSYGGGYGGGYPQEQGTSYEQQQPKSHTRRNEALGVAAGLAGGALLMHEGEKVEENWDEDKYRMESDVDRADNYVDRKFDDGVQDVEDAPEDAARWTGRKVQEVEDIPQDIERKWDDGVQDVEDIPDDVAGWTGRKVGDVERVGDDVDRYGDNLDNAYDQGRNDARYDDY